MTPNEYQALALRTEDTPQFLNSEHDLNRCRLLHGSIGLCTETGELQDAIKKELIYGREMDRVNIVEESGDLLWYLALVLDSVGSNMEEAMLLNIAKLKKRFPNGFTEVEALNRDLESERSALEGDDG